MDLYSSPEYKVTAMNRLQTAGQLLGSLGARLVRVILSPLDQMDTDCTKAQETLRELHSQRPLDD